MILVDSWLVHHMATLTSLLLLKQEQSGQRMLEAFKTAQILSSEDGSSSMLNYNVTDIMIMFFTEIILMNSCTYLRKLALWVLCQNSCTLLPSLSSECGSRTCRSEEGVESRK
jgi:hypothetical protein